MIFSIFSSILYTRWKIIQYSFLHITSDLEKIADRIIFIHKGKNSFEKDKDELKDNYGVLKLKMKKS